VALDGKSQSCHGGDAGRIAGTGERDLLRRDVALLRLDSEDAPLADAKTGRGAILDDVDAAAVSRAGVAPGDGIVAHRAAAGLKQAASDGEARIVEIDERHQRAHLLAIEQLGIDAVQPHGIAAPRIGVPLRIRMEHIQTPRWLTMVL
jgi:hypothetical protein